MGSNIMIAAQRSESALVEMQHGQEEAVPRRSSLPTLDTVVSAYGSFQHSATRKAIGGVV